MLPARRRALFGGTQANPMSKPIDPDQPKSGEICVEASQLRPGVHVRLPVQWMDHQFLFNSFVIANDDQVRQIAAMRLPRIFCDPARCKAPPLPVAAPQAAEDAAEEARLSALTAQQRAEKQERIAVMNEIRAHLDVTQKHYLTAARSVSGAIKHFDADPKASVREVVKVSEGSTQLLLTDVDSAIVLIAEKGHSDGFAAHALSVMTLSLLLGKQARLPAEALHVLGAGALLHDVGQLAINSSILRNAGRNKYEEAAYQAHCQIGHESVRRAGRIAEAMLQAILHHHERYDGAGYPDHLQGDAIHVAARVIAIANRFDNLVNPIDFRQAVSPSEALSTMWVKEKGAFDPLLLQLFVRAMGVYPPGTIVRLSDGRIGAVVVSASTSSPLAPQVMVYEPDLPRSQAIIIDLAREDSIRIDGALRLQERPAEELDYLLPRRTLSWFPTGQI